MTSSDHQHNSPSASVSMMLILCAAGIGSLSAVSGMMAGLIGLIILGAFVFVVTKRPRVAFLAVLVLRPAMDFLNERSVVTVAGVPLNVSSIVALLMIVWVTLLVIKHRRYLPRHIGLAAFVTVVLIALAGLPGSESFSLTVRELLRLTSILAVGVGSLILFHSARDLSVIVKALVVSLIAPIGFATMQFMTNNGLAFGGIGNRLYGTFAHPNVFGFFLVLAITVLYGWLLAADMPRRSKRVGYAGIALLGMYLALTYTRGAWIGMVIVLAVYGLLHYRKATLAAAGVGVFLVILLPVVNTLTLSFWNIDLTQNSVIARLSDSKAESSSVEWRFTVWRDMEPRIFDRPVLGHGLGIFPLLRERQIRDYFQDTEAHNDYLRLGVETGLLGLAMYIILLGTILVMSIQRYHAASTNQHRLQATIPFALVLSFGVMSMFDNLLQGTAVMWWLWTILFLFTRTPRIEKAASR